MTGRRFIGRDRDWHRLARLTLVLFALRALLPVGFMPDLGLLKQGGFQIVLCTAQGPATVTVDADGNPQTPDGTPADAAFAKDCPFGTAFGKAFALPAVVAALPLLAAADAVLARFLPLDLRPPAQGPPLGSRAPPTRLG